MTQQQQAQLLRLVGRVSLTSYRLGRYEDRYKREGTPLARLTQPVQHARDELTKYLERLV